MHVVGFFVGKLKEVTFGILQLLEKNGGDDETRTRDLCRDSSKNDDSSGELE